jgi:hypothetical protein
LERKKSAFFPVSATPISYQNDHFAASVVKNGVGAVYWMSFPILLEPIDTVRDFMQ